jgi:hypothetical protein
LNTHLKGGSPVRGRPLCLWSVESGSYTRVNASIRWSRG